MRALGAWRAVLAAAVGALALGATSAPGAVTLPPANGQFDYQIGGAYTPVSSVAIVDRDRTAAPVAGKYNVCYVNAFQTQPGEAAWWKANYNSLLLKKNGSYVTDPGYPDEIVLDTSTAAKRASLATIVNGWIDGCGSAGYKAIEPDNLDSWTRSKHLLTKSGNQAFATLLATHAHSVNLAIAQKNTTELAAIGKSSIGFDFAIAEECHVYSECGAYTATYGNQVYEIEYTDNGGLSNYTAACSALGSTISIIYRDRDVVPSGTSGYTYKWC